MFYHSFTEKRDQRVLAVCDEDLLGEVLQGEDLDFEVKKSFYGEEPIGKEELLKKARDSTIINAVGCEVVSFLAEKDFFDEDKILKIDGVKHAQMARI